MQKLCFIILLSLTLPASVKGQALWPGASGGGMMSVQNATMLYPGHGALGLTLDNYDRDPLGLDVFDTRIDWRLGVSPKIEIFGRYYMGHAVSVPGVTPIPPSPVDIFSTHPIYPPYRSVYWPMPYLHHHTGVVNEFIPGEYIFGAKYHLRSQKLWIPETAISGSVSIPGDMDISKLQNGSGSGSIDANFLLANTWHINRLSISSNIGYQINSTTQISDRLVLINGESTSLRETVLQRPDFLIVGLGVCFAVNHHIGLITEIYHRDSIGHATPIFYGAGATDILGGIALQAGPIGITAGLRQHLGPPPNAIPLSTGPLSGALDLSMLSADTQRDYLSSIGVPPALHRPGSSLLVLGFPTNSALPAGAHYVPDTYLTHTTGNGGIVITLSISF